MSVYIGPDIVNRLVYPFSTSFFSNAYTISAWFKIYNITSSQVFLYYIAGYNDYNAYLSVSNSGVYVYCPNNSNNYWWYAVSPYTFSSNTWYNVTVTRDFNSPGSSEDIHIYINGYEASYSTRQYFQVMQETFIILVVGRIGTPYNGECANLALWTRTLNGDEVLCLSQGLSPLYLRKNLYSFWPLTNNSIDVISGTRSTNSSSPTDSYLTFYQDPIRRHFPSKPKSDFYTFKWWEAPAPQPKKDRPSLIFLGGEIFQF